MNGSLRPLLLLVPCLCVMALLPSTSQATRQDDSLHAAINGESNAAERSEALLQLAAERMERQPGECLVHARNALAFAERSNDRERMHRALVLMRGIQHRFGVQEEFLRSAIQAMQLSEALGDAPRMADDLQWLSLAYEQLGDMDRAVDMSRKALFLLSTTGDSTGIGRGMLHLINALVTAGRFDEVIAQGESALAYYVSKGDSIGQAGVWTSEAEAYMARGRMADALPLLHKAERVLAIAGLQQERFKVLSDLAEVYISIGQPDRARDFLGTTMLMADDLGFRAQKPRLLKLSSRLHEAEGDLRAALADVHAFTALQDSILNERIAERMAGMQALYQLDAKDRQNEQLEQRNTTNEALIATARMRDRWWFGGFSVLMVLLVMATFMLVNRRKTVRRIRMKNHVIRQQAEEIHSKNLELERQNLRLAETLISEEEKAVLLREIHHRVKNNLQIVNTLLRLQGEHVSDPRFITLLSEAQGRVRAMAMVHEHIYRHGDLARIDLAEHLRLLASAIIDSFDARGRVQLDVQALVQHATLDVLIPLSLVVNELLTNSMKHAFPQGRQGRVRIVLTATGNGAHELFYSDDGVGADENIRSAGGSFGWSLMRSFAAQLDGELRVLKGDGTTVVLSFRTDAVRSTRSFERRA